MYSACAVIVALRPTGETEGDGAEGVEGEAEGVEGEEVEEEPVPTSTAEEDDLEPIAQDGEEEEVGGLGCHNPPSHHRDYEYDHH